MAGKQIKVSRRMLFTWCMLGGFILLLSPGSLTSKLPLAFARIFGFPLRVGRSISLSVNSQQPGPGGADGMEVQYQNYIANLEAELEQERRKMEKLSGLRSRRPLEGANLVFADVIKASVSGFQSELIINRGRRDGLARGQFVLGDNSIIGTVATVDTSTASVRLITDPASRIEVTIADTSRIMQGAGGNSAKVEMLSTEHKIKLGQRVYAKKKPGLLDVATIAGKVSQCKVDGAQPLLWDVTVAPACNMETLSSVAVIIMNSQDRLRR